MKETKNGALIDRIGLGVFLVIFALGAVQAAKYMSLGVAVMALTALVLEALIVLAAWAAWSGRMPFLLIAVAVGGFVLNSFLNYGETTNFGSLFVIQGVIGGAWAILGTVFMLVKKEKPGKLPWVPLALLLLTLGCVGWFWKSNVDRDRAWDGHAKRTIWAVPEKFDTGEIEEAGT
ncbi:MAG: hypothetical protein UH229_07390, partial [Lachnospiraceae bacterium]|nr:hypothetical protein [Lachnospiraceae bacterium]